MPKLKDLTGQTFGRLTVIERAENSKSNMVQWKCLCECGNTIIVQAGNLRNGNTKSCKCLRNTRSGKSQSRLYAIWANMNARCSKIDHPYYNRYGGRGISVCEEWKNDFISFQNWAIATGYTENLTIDRIDFNGNYNPTNCRWATQKEQQNNKSNNKFITYNGKTQTIAEWADEFGINKSTLHARLKYQNWSIEKALLNNRGGE